MGTVLVTGGAGFVGTHVLAVLVAAGRQCISIDNYSNSSPRAIEGVRGLAPGAIEEFEVDIRDTAGLKKILAGKNIDSVIHLAGLKSVGESVEFPERYHDNNVHGTVSLLEALATTRARKFVFSSSATVYGMAETMPIPEAAPSAPQNPYGQTKLDVERLLVGLARSDPSWRVANLRYFNPVGAHESGMIGEDPAGVPNNLMPYVCQVAAGRREALRIFGNDYPTPDGTGIRDYIHVVDLAEGHVKALEYLDGNPLPGPLPRERGNLGRLAGERENVENVFTVNLGTGRGYSVLELVETFERVNGVRVPRVFTERRPGDVAVCYADCSRAKEVLGWTARRGLEEMCRDAWRWQRMNPDGYRR